jgi:hypothetical protein
MVKLVSSAFIPSQDPCLWCHSYYSQKPSIHPSPLLPAPCPPVCCRLSLSL